MEILSNNLVTTLYLLSILFLILILFAIIFFVIYKNKQTNLYNEKKLKEIEFQNNLLQKEIENHKQLQIDRERIARDLHDDLGSSISSIKLTSQILQTQNANLQTKSDLQDIIENATQITESMREMIWNLNSKNEKLSSLIEHIELYAKKILNSNKINNQISLQSYFPDIELPPVIKRNIFLTIKEIINNIIKHASATKVQISIHIQNNILSINIIDNGVGIQTTNTNGNGLQNIMQRISNIGGKIYWKNGSKNGIETFIQIPIQEYIKQ